MLMLVGEKRVSGSADTLRKEGKVPAVVYGPKQEAIPASVSLIDFTKVFRQGGESSVIDLSGLSGTPMQVLVHDVQFDPINGTPSHVDFYAIQKGAKVEVDVPLSFVGESDAVRGGANLVKVLHEVKIEAAPADLPHELVVDISSLVSVGDKIHVSDITLPKGVILLDSPEDVVALAQAVEEEKEETAGPVDMNAIEVEKKGKEENPEESA